MLDYLLDVFEDFRLYCMSFWSDFYKWKSYFQFDICQRYSYIVLNNIYRQSLTTRMFLTALVVVFGGLIVFKIWYKYTTRYCKSKTKLNGKTVLITGANVGKLTYSSTLFL